MAKCKLSTDIAPEDAENLVARPFMRVAFMGTYRAAGIKFGDRLDDLVVCLLKADALDHLVDRNAVSGGTLVVVFEPEGVVPLAERFHTVIQDIARGRPVTGLIIENKTGLFEEVDLVGFALRENGENFVRMVDFARGGGRSNLEMIDRFWVPE